MLDLLPAARTVDMDGVARLQRLKTGAIISWAVESGAVLGQASNEIRTSLRGYSQDLGLAFQIADDLLDARGDQVKVGKRVGKDASQGRDNYVTLMGVDRARRQANLLVEQAIDHLRSFEHRADLLIAIARFAVERDH